MFASFIEKITSKKDLTTIEMQQAISEILSGKIAEKDIIQFLTALRDKKESEDEIKGAILTIRQKAQTLSLKTKDVMDVCGTGGDGKNTFNISTASAFVVAGCGIPVAKHGNVAVSSQSGSADVLRELGVNIEASIKTVEKCIDQTGIGFLFAPYYHSTLKAVSQARQKIKTKTIFNILGPLLNPAQAKKQVIGVFDERLLEIVASVLKELGSTSVAVVFGQDGLDEVTLTTKTKICFLKNGNIYHEIFDPQSVGYNYCQMQDLAGSGAIENAQRMKQLLKGHSQALDHCVHLNAALAILVYGKTDNFKEALLMAQDSISSGRAYQKLEALIEVSHQK